MLRSPRILRRMTGMAQTKAPSDPLIAIVGATGTGKSELAVALARCFNGEIINGDAMQLYAGLPIITNKIPPEEQHGIPHHLLGCIGLKEQTWVVGTFVKKALDVIEEIRARGRLPILVGGTHYYTQALLFKDGLTDKEKPELDGGPRHEMLDLPTEDLLKELERVDPVMANRWHPNDRRKIQRSLEIYLKSGRKASDIYAEQRLLKKGTGEHDQAGDVSDMRFSTLLFWVHSNTEALRSRLDKRVETMLANGLLDEVRTLQSHAMEQKAHGEDIDETRGIWMSIGYKEYKDYATALEDGKADEKTMETLSSRALERTQASTRQYAKRQIRWIRIKLLNALAEAEAQDKIFLLDSSDVAEFNVNVVNPAVDITQEFLECMPLPVPTSLSSLAEEQLQPARHYDMSSAPEKWEKQYCNVCGITSVTPEAWAQHTKSKAHRKLISKRREAAVAQQQQDQIAREDPGG